MYPYLRIQLLLAAVMIIVALVVTVPPAVRYYNGHIAACQDYPTNGHRDCNVEWTRQVQKDTPGALNR
jgi:hypothetical protein